MKNFILLPLLLAFSAPILAAPEIDLEALLAARPTVNEALTPEQAVAIALRESPVVRGAVAEVEAQAGRLKAAQSERKLSLSANTFLSGGSLSNIVESPMSVQPSMIMNLPAGAYFDQNLMLMFPLYTSGRLKAMAQQAAANRNASQAELETQRQEVALLTRMAYREAQARRSLIEVQKARLLENQEQLRVDRARAEEGKIPAFYVQRDEAEVAATQQELTNSLRDVELSLVQLKTVMGVHPASRIELVESLNYQPSAEFLKRLMQTPPVPEKPDNSANLSALLRLAGRQRPELQAASERIRAAQAETSGIGSSYRPQVNAFAMGDVLKMRGSGVRSGTTFGLAASIPILNGGQKGARLQTANAERQKQESERERMALQVAQEVSNALLNLRAAEQNIGTAQAALKAAQEDYRVARLRYEAGKSIVVEAMDALAARVRAESNVVQALYGYNVARDQLLRAVGDLPTP